MPRRRGKAKVNIQTVAAPPAGLGGAGGMDPGVAEVDQALAGLGIDSRVGMLSGRGRGPADAAAPPEGFTPPNGGDAPAGGIADFQRNLAMQGPEAFAPVLPAEGPPSDPAMVTVLVQTAMQRMDAGAAEAWAKMDGDTVIVRWRFKREEATA